MSEFPTILTSSPSSSNIPSSFSPKRVKYSIEPWKPYDAPWKMHEVMPHVFMSSWPLEIPDNIIYTLNVCNRLPVIRPNHRGIKNHWTISIDPDKDILMSLAHIIGVMKNALPSIPQSSIAAEPESRSLLNQSSSVQRTDHSLSAPSQPFDVSPVAETNILIYSQHGLNRAAIAVLAYICIMLGINIVDAFFLLKEKISDISPAEKLMEQVQDFIGEGEVFEGSVGKEILRRIVKDKGLKEVMEKAKSENWMYEAEE
ncbi:hypothetical protein WAI453_011052 [Rhynchosporium graminicola]|uniref:Uncharacterized protein n=1 Tax=Rhynchosporium graminicola TaxID=2792576 RepID=A0A1E1L0C5_9HELO|nr:uncharacterized protein RCO7_05610 [Rhynchosporium commune]